MSCVVCGNVHNNSKYTVSEMMFGFRDKFEYFQCSRCGCLQIITVPDNLVKYYPPEYYKIITKTPKSGSKLWRFLRGKLVTYALTGKSKLIGGALSWVTPSRREELRAAGLLDLQLTRQSRILDVGCSNGELLFFLAEGGFKNVLGIDRFIESDIVYSNGATVRKAALEDVRGEYDLIMFQHSFEHMPNQLEVLRSVSCLLAGNGYCLINMPTVSSHAWRLYKENWAQLDAPRHLCIHSRDSIRMLACEAGFEVSKVVCNSWSFQFWGSIQYQKGIPLYSEKSYMIDPSKSIFSREQITEFERRAKELNLMEQGDAAVFYTKKVVKD